MGKKIKHKFNVLLMDFSNKKKEEYDVIPYFESTWKNKKFNFDKKDVKNFEDFKVWIKRASSYMYWARCQYEFLMAPWPFGSYQFKQDMSELLKQAVDLSDINDNIKFSNIITKEMHKIDVHEQIMMNLDVFAKILMEHLNIDFEKPKKK